MIDLLPKPRPVALKFQCAMCLAEKKDTNHWWLIYTVAREFRLRPWDEELAKGNGVRSICGRACALKAQSKFMEAVSSGA